MAISLLLIVLSYWSNTCISCCSMTLLTCSLWFILFTPILPGSCLSPDTRWGMQYWDGGIQWDTNVMLQSSILSCYKVTASHGTMPSGTILRIYNFIITYHGKYADFTLLKPQFVSSTILISNTRQLMHARNIKYFVYHTASLWRRWKV